MVRAAQSWLGKAGGGGGGGTVGKQSLPAAAPPPRSGANEASLLVATLGSCPKMEARLTGGLVVVGTLGRLMAVVGGGGGGGGGGSRLAGGGNKAGVCFASLCLAWQEPSWLQSAVLILCGVDP